MEKSEIANEIRRVIRGELDDCERALKAGDTAKVFNRVIASDYP